ncbi:hypothetical protein [Mangrovimonas futianensis]|uniref:hypothetical protein n=1 Tax=Mangrovimonas futianensis TaxID=2895523 RepID=UPI001E2842B2|nr:hypothetical protein [Mangrovimonas futianensis]MCF1422685.1 hypothetical protein [Mangrovimonas futianensis]
MNEWLKISYNRIFVCVLFVLIVANVVATISENEILLKITKPLFVPVFLMYYLIKNKHIGTAFVAFLLTSFLGDFSSIFISDGNLHKLSNLFYFISYLSLLILISTKIKKITIDKVIGLYFVLVVSINSYFLYELFGILRIQIPDQVELGFFVAKSLALLLLAFTSFVVYLNSDSKPSIIFLMAAICFGFADILYYVSNYYIYSWSFVMLDRVLHVFGLFFLFNYMIGFNRKLKKDIVEARLQTTSSQTRDPFLEKSYLDHY